MEHLQLKMRLLYKEKEGFFFQSEHKRLDEICDVFVEQIHIARRAEEETEAEAADLSEQLSAAQSALAAAEESAAHSTALAQRHLDALRSLPVLPESALTGACQDIGAGGCGTITVQGLSLAFKRPQVKGDPLEDEGYYQMFLEETALIVELRHANLVQCVTHIHDGAGKLAAFGMPRGQHDLWRELQSYGGGQSFGPYPAPRVKRVGLAVISALRYLHSTAGITHHDVKLGNVLSMKDGSIQVADFGLAARLDCDGFSAQLGLYRGTPGESVHPYSILRKWRPGPHDDLWGLAMMLAEMITGRPLAIEQSQKLNQLIADYDSGRDKAGLDSLDLDCCSYGILCPTLDQRLAALQAQSDIQIRPQPKIPGELLLALHGVLRPSENSESASSAASSAAALDSLEAALQKIPDPVIQTGLGRQLQAPPPSPLPVPQALPGLFPLEASGAADAAAGHADAAAPLPVTGAGDPAGRPADSARFLHGTAEQHIPVLELLHMAQQQPQRPQRPQPRRQFPHRPQPMGICAC